VALGVAAGIFFGLERMAASCEHVQSVVQQRAALAGSRGRKGPVGFWGLIIKRCASQRCRRVCLQAAATAGAALSADTCARAIHSWPPWMVAS
jgi:hypothetical protein